MTGRRATPLVAPVVVLAICLTACAAGSSSNSPAGTSNQRRHPHPVKTVVRNYRTYRAGETGSLVSPAQHAVLHIAVGSPTRSTTSLSKSYGYAPRYGHYVTFRLTVTNSGTAPILLRRLDFWVQTPGAGKTTTDAGNAPFSGSGSQLDTTQLAPGHRVTNDLTFDVAHPTGTLFYGPGGRRELAWTF